MNYGEEKIRTAIGQSQTQCPDNVWISRASEQSLIQQMALVREKQEQGQHLPLAGKLMAVKDNIDVAGFPTTAACTEYSYTPQFTATAIQKLIDAGAIVFGKTNLDQFATGLVGTRSPYGTTSCYYAAEKISGGSSSGSAVAVAAGVVDFSIGTDTAGSGRVPAAFHGLYGIKPTLGIISNSGVVPACVDYDAMSIFSNSLELAALVSQILRGFDPHFYRSRPWPQTAPLSAPQQLTLGVPAPENLIALSHTYRVAFEKTIRSYAEYGHTLVEMDLCRQLSVAEMLYDASIVAQRYQAVGPFLESEPNSADPVVKNIIKNAKHHTAHQYISDQITIKQVSQETTELFSKVDALIIPTTTEHPTLAEIREEPLSINRRLGTYTNFCNLLDLSAIAFPGHKISSTEHFGVTALAPKFHDQILLDVVADLTTQPRINITPEHSVYLAVFGAHMTGQPLHFQLEQRKARFAGKIQTAPEYRLFALKTEPPKPGLVHQPNEGAAIDGEMYALTPEHLGTFLAELPAPMSLTQITLNDGSLCVGFSCTHHALDGAEDITHHGGWLTYLSHT